MDRLPLSPQFLQYKPYEEGVYSVTKYDRKDDAWTPPIVAVIEEGPKGFVVKLETGETHFLCRYHRVGHTAWKKHF